MRYYRKWTEKLVEEWKPLLDEYKELKQWWMTHLEELEKERENERKKENGK